MPTDSIFGVRITKEGNVDWACITTRYGEVMISSSSAIDRIVVSRKTPTGYINLGEISINPDLKG